MQTPWYVCVPRETRKVLRSGHTMGHYDMTRRRCVDFLRPSNWADCLAAKAAQPDAVPIAGGTDLMVELNFDHRRPPALLDLTPVAELADWSTVDGRVRIGAGVPYTRIITELGDQLPGLAMASRTVGSPQIRNRGTAGGNLGTASPAGRSEEHTSELQSQFHLVCR